FRCRNVAVDGVENVDARVQRDGLAGTGWSGNKDHAVRFRQRIEVKLLLERLVTQRINAELCAGRIEDTQHDLFAEQRRAGVDAEIDGARLRQLHLDAAVLRHTTFGDVHARHDLETRRNLSRKRDRWLGDLTQHAVHAETHAV